nr:MAG TPA: hypothetical protein [Caudoviricetes sp.]
MTKQELINFIDERIDHIERVKSKAFNKGDKLNTQYFDGQCGVYKQLRIFAEDLDEPKAKKIEVKVLQYSRLMESMRETTEVFNSLMEYTSWLRFITVKYPDIIIKEVNFKEVE